MLTTPKFGLQKPEDADAFDQAPFNSNADKLDKMGVWCDLSNSVNIALGVGTSTITFDTEVSDLDNLHAPNGSRITAATAGIYLVTARARVDVGAGAAGDIEVNIAKNGAQFATERVPTAPASSVQTKTVTSLVKLAATDYVELTIFCQALSTLIAAGYSAKLSALLISPVIF